MQGRCWTWEEVQGTGCDVAAEGIPECSAWGWNEVDAVASGIPVGKMEECMKNCNTYNIIFTHLVAAAGAMWKAWVPM